MRTTSMTRRVLAGVASCALGLGLIACTGCAATGEALNPGAHTYHELDTNWDLAYGWYEADTPEGFYVNDLGTTFSTTQDKLYTFDNPGLSNSSDYQSIQVRLERGVIDSYEVKTSASDTAWKNDPVYENAIASIESNTSFEELGVEKIGELTWTILEADPALDSAVTSERKVAAADAKKSCKYVAQLDDTAYVVVDGYQIAADDDLIKDFLASMKTLDSDYYDTFAAWSLENSISKKSAAGMW